MPKKSKMVGCSTLMKRLNNAGLGHLYKVRQVDVMPNEELFMEEQMEPSLIDFDTQVSPLMMDQCDMDQVYRDGSCVNIDSLAEDQCIGNDLMWNASSKKCKRKLNDIKSKDIDYSIVTGFDTSYGKRYMSGSRPKKLHKHVGTIVVKGRTHHVFKGKEGGLYYLKGKTGNKVYIDKNRLRKRK
jgi:hypothetical protein